MRPHRRGSLAPRGGHGKPGRLANLSETLSEAKTVWQRLTIPGWYGKAERRAALASRHRRAAPQRQANGGAPLGEAAAGSARTARGIAAKELIRDPLGRFEPQALLCTTPEYNTGQGLRWFVQRWPWEVTFEATRSHLGIEIQRQCSDHAMARTTPCLLGLFSLVTRPAARLRAAQRRGVVTSAWYRKSQPTFSNTLALVRRPIWHQQGFLMARRGNHVAKPNPALQKASVSTLCHAA